MDEIKTDIKDQILRGASELFWRYGIKSITMDEIARHLSISKKTIYQYFEDKEVLVNSFVHAMGAEIQNEMLATMQGTTDVIEELVKSSEYMKAKVCNVNPCLLFDLRKYHIVGWKLWTEHKSKFMVGFIKQSIERGIEQGLFRKTINPMVLAKLRMEQVEMGFNPDIFPADKFNVNEVQMQFFLHFIYGISTVKGHERINKLMHITE